MTNTLTFIATVTTTSFLATNTTIEYPKRWVPIPCPEKLPGCLVYHARAEDDTVAGIRFLVTTITETRKTRIEGPGYTNSFYDPPNVIRREHVEEKLQANWIRTSSAALVSPSFSIGSVYFSSTNFNVLTNTVEGPNIRFRSAETNTSTSK